MNHSASNKAIRYHFSRKRDVRQWFFPFASTIKAADEKKKQAFFIKCRVRSFPLFPSKNIKKPTTSEEKQQKEKYVKGQQSKERE